MTTVIRIGESSGGATLSLGAAWRLPFYCAEQQLNRLPFGTDNLPRFAHKGTDNLPKGTDNLPFRVRTVPYHLVVEHALELATHADYDGTQ